MPKWIKEAKEPIPSQTIVEAMNLYHEYLRTQDGFEAPVSKISIESSDTKPDSRAMQVHIDLNYKETDFHMRSVQSSDAEDVFKYLTSQPVVCRQYATKKTSDLEATKARVQVLVDRYDPETAASKSGLFMHGGFTVTGENEEFLGLINTGSSGTPGLTEIGVRFRADAWSHAPENLEKEFNIPSDERLKTTYSGAGTAAVCALWDYTRETTKRGYKLQEHDVIGMRAVCMIDNPGGWKAQVKAGMIPRDVDAVESYGPEIRFQTQKLIL